jgi:RNA polymerase sigma factor (sigma-70 family)
MPNHFSRPQLFMKEGELIPHLFRTEFSKIVSVLGKVFGFEHTEVAEDITSETFLLAAETWGQKGIPENPTGWLYTVAKNKARTYLNRESLFSKTIAPGIIRSSPAFEEIEIDLSAQNIQDSQLQMMFAICHPAIPAEAQIGLSLRILCGFGIDEIAEAFLASKETINKRLFRAREKLREEKVTMEMPGQEDIPERLAGVLKTLYLLFNEGYYSGSQDTVLRKDLCVEAMRLNYMLLDYAYTNTPETNALLALMCFHASRFDARTGENGTIILYADQDSSLWNVELISRGEHYLNASATGKRLSKYHLEAAIAYWHTQQQDSPEKWENILQLYNELLQVEYSPMAALNRTYALSKANSLEEAIREAEKLDLSSYHLYYTLLGELYKSINPGRAKDHFQLALSLAKSNSDKQIIQLKLMELARH